MSVPVICPHCYKNLPAPASTPDGLIRCDACGHAFPASGGTAPSSPTYQAPSYGSAPLPPYNPPGYGQPPAYNPAPSYSSGAPNSPLPFGNSPSNQGPPYSTPTGGKYPAAYPPAGGPQKPGNPGLVACGVIALFGLLGIACCGAGGFVVHQLANDAQLANQPDFNFNQPNINPPIVPAPINPPPPINIPPFEIRQPEFPQIPPPVVPTIDPFEPSPVSPPVIPNTPVSPASPGTIPGIPLPRATIPTAPAGPRTLDMVLSELKTADATNFNTRKLVEELTAMPVEDTRRDEIIDAVLDLFRRASEKAFLIAHDGQLVLEKWTTSAESLKLAKFAVEDKNQSVRRNVLQVIAKTGGDTETAKTILPLMKDPGMIFPIRDALEKIGPPAEDPLLEYLEANSGQTPNLFLYQTLGKVGGAKTKARMQALAESRTAASGFARIALGELQKREAAAK